ncbi:FAD-binding oxidoreductase [Collinsella sp. An2]|uniref:FAD-binding oxidoreductase n=1 Tax=Collinsella sp. An2 TaxID=1965585 RepID=UPI000B39A9DF|nr:FAD-binding oxidoreductase [Collinsella sp. An2]OUP07700.1 FAD-binding oxidoreductase [Collinsella sp. An2]
MDAPAAGAEESVRQGHPLIRAFTAEFDDYRHDESRSQGEAQSISFPQTEEDVCEVLRTLHGDHTPITVQGARTGLAAGAMPHGGHVLNLSRMNRCLGLRRDADGSFFLLVQPGVVLSELRKYLKGKSIPSAGWDESSLEALSALQDAPEQMFPTDPTEASACLGGMAACNASGARSFRYGPMRPHVTALRLALADGDVVDLRRGQVFARGRHLELSTEAGRTISVDLPTYDMPHAKNASGYFVQDDMDAIDLVIGSDGTLGVITQLELALMPTPPVIWGVSCFFADEHQALDATVGLRDEVASAAAIEYFDPASLDILRTQREQSTAFSALPLLAADAACCVYVELHCQDEDLALAELDRVGGIVERAGGSEAATWVARTELDRESLQFFRHAVPESVNMLIDARRRTDPAITKLGSDMSVPDDRLHDVIELYRTTLSAAGLEAAAWGHIGNNHLHVNVLPRSSEEYARGKALFGEWAREVTSMGGAVSAEHGVGKLKRDFLAIMYGEEHLREMARVKLAFDPYGQLGRGNLFDASLLEGGA